MESTPSKITVVGLGYVGLPLALLLINNGFDVLGIDVDKSKINNLRQGISYLADISDDELKAILKNGSFSATTDYTQIPYQDVIIICVPTPLSNTNTPDLSYLQRVAIQLYPYLKQDQLVILESSVYPGTTNEVLKPILEKSGLEAGKDFGIGYSPERIDPGSKGLELQQIPKLISGLTEESLNQTYHLYSKIFNKVVKVPSIEVAEMAKLLENSYRFINISFINEMAMLSDEIGIDIWDVIEAASTKPYGFQSFYPGPGIGGHCIPVDPLYLSWKIEQYGLKNYFIPLANQINHQISYYIIQQIEKLLAKRVPLSKAKILIYGVTYKKDINDLRESSALPIIRLLLKEGSQVSYHDPYISNFQLDGRTFTSVPITKDSLKDADCVLIVTDHSVIPIDMILENATFVYDTHNITKGKKGKANVVRLGGGSL